jgi:hypothetical protein
VKGSHLTAKAIIFWPYLLVKPSIHPARWIFYFPKHSMTTHHFDFDRFRGFTYPTTTPVPDLLFDHVMQELNEGELKVLLYIIRRTFGFKKQSDDISLAQMVEGIVTKEGKVLDRGTGLSKKTIMAALRSLKDKNLIEATRNRDEEKGNLPTSYRLKMDVSLGEESTPRGGEEFTPRARGKIYPIQQTELQETVKQQHKRDNENNNRGSRPEPAKNIVVALTKWGITEKVARDLAHSHNADAIYQQIDFHEFEMATNPHKIKSPSGRLRTRIEENWSPPDGYSPDWRERLAAEKVKAEQTRQEREVLQASLINQGGTKYQEQEHIRQEQLAAAKRHYNTSETHEKIWTAVKTDLIGRVGEAEYKTFVAGSELLTADNDQVTIWVRHRFLAKEIEKRYGAVLKQLLAQHLHISPDGLAVKWVHPPPTSPANAARGSG